MVTALAQMMLEQINTLTERIDASLAKRAPSRDKGPARSPSRGLSHGIPVRRLNGDAF